MSEPMRIDGRPLSEYGAKLLDWKPGAPSLDNTVTPGKNYSFPRLLHSEIAPKALTATINVIGRNYSDAVNKASALILAANKTTELFMPDGYYYRSALSSVSEIEWNTPWIAEFMLTFISVQHGAMVTIDVPRNNYPVHYLGTAPAGFVAEFTAPAAIQDITIFGMQITSIPAGAKIAIDGIEKSVTQNGENKFAETNIVDFPAFDPQNPDTVISMSQYVPLKISYYPTYI